VCSTAPSASFASVVDAPCKSTYIFKCI
jgi:hypothetical protein